MDRSLKWRTIILIASTLLAVLMLVPTMVPSGQLPIWYANLFNQKIQLGLDLQGGLHIVYSIDLDKAVDDKASDIKRELEARMSESKIAGRVTTPLRPVGAVNVILDDPKNLDQVRGDLLGALLEDGVIVTRDCDPGLAGKALCVRVSTDYAEGLKSSALEQAVRTVRERIDERGVAEPSVVTKGDQIIVELPGLDKDSIKRVKDIIQRTAKLEFKVVDDSDPFMRKVYSRVLEDIRKNNPGADDSDIIERGLTTSEGIGIGIDQWEHQETGKSFQDWYLTAKNHERAFSIAEAKERDCWRADRPEVGGKMQCPVLGREVLEDYLAVLAAETDASGGTPYTIDDDHQWGFELMRSSQSDREPVWRTYYLHRPVELAGSSVANSYVYW